MRGRRRKRRRGDRLQLGASEYLDRGNFDYFTCLREGRRHPSPWPLPSTTLPHSTTLYHTLPHITTLHHTTTLPPTSPPRYHTPSLHHHTPPHYHHPPHHHTPHQHTTSKSNTPHFHLYSHIVHHTRGKGREDFSKKEET